MMSRSYRDYWDQNIDKWADLYGDISHGHETLNGPPWLRWLYSHTLAKHEAALMRARYVRTIRFLDRYVGAGCEFVDIGCGTGLFVVEALKRQAIVHAVDFSTSALEISKQRVSQYGQYGIEATVTYHQLDIQRAPIPRCDVAMMVGVTPYIADLDAALGNVLPWTKTFFCQYSDSQHWANRLRTAVPSLNVRSLIFHPTRAADRLYQRHGFRLIERQPFATGYIDIASSWKEQTPHL